MFYLENDNIYYDRCAFRTLAEAQAFLRRCCQYIAECNVEPNGVCQAGKFQGMRLEQIAEGLYQKNVDTIEER